jgi:anti-sigma regulatory factor (Ser/Thr protein kinase)
VTDALETFEHLALFYRGDAEYLDGVVPFLLEGLDRGQAVAVAVPGRNLMLVEKALEDLADEVRLIDMERAGRNPGGILPGVLYAFADAHPGPVRIVGEPIWAERTPEEYPACVQHEALINRAFAGRDLTVLCPYDSAELKPAVLADAERTHPELRDSCGGWPSPRYDPMAVLTDYNLPLPAPAAAAEFRFDLTLLAAARAFAETWSARYGLRHPRRGDLVLAASELCTNSVLYAGGEGVLRLWREPAQVVLEVCDRGTVTDPLAGRVPAPSGRPGGRGLVLVNRLADLVRMHRALGGTRVRAFFRR